MTSPATVISVASAFDAHLSGIACAYEPVVGEWRFLVWRRPLIDAFRAEREAAAHRAKNTFDENARRAAISADSIVISGTASEAATRLGELARDHDLSIVAQAQPDSDITESMAIESMLFGWTARAGSALHSIVGPETRPRDGVLGWQPKCRARRRRRDALPEACWRHRCRDR